MRLAQLAIRRPVTVLMAVTAVGLFGYVSLERLPLNLLPPISYPSLTVQTDYQDAAPEEIEALVTRRVEETVGVVGGLTRITSVSRPGQSEVVLEFDWNTNMDLASVEVREKLDLVEFPEDAERPVILRFDPSNEPILRVQVYGGLTLARLRDIVERDLSKRLEAVDGVAAIKVAGGREEQIRVELDERRAAELGLSITEVTNILRQENLNQASGSLYDLDMNYMVRMVNEFRSIDEVRGIVVSDQAGRKILLEDIARVWRGSKEREVIARFNGRESVEMAVYKEGDANTVVVAEAVQRRLGELAKEPTFPRGLETSVVFDHSRFITSSVVNVLQSALAGGILATAVLFLFLRDGRSTAIIAASIPISVMATLAAMYQADITLNIMSLGGVALGIGMLVDNSIVVLEAAHRHRSPKVPLAESVATGTAEVAMPVAASTLTTVAVFLPMVFVEGIGGQLFRDQALTITFSLFASLAVALTVIPTLLAARLRTDRELAIGPERERNPPAGRGAARWLRDAGRFASEEAPRILLLDLRRGLLAATQGSVRAIGPALRAFDRGFAALASAYARTLSSALDAKGRVLAGVAVALMVAVLLLQNLGGELIPVLQQGEFSFEISLPEGRPLEATDRLVREVEDRALEIPGVEAVFSSVGGSLENQFASGDLEEHIGTLHVVLDDREDEALEADVIRQVRAIIAAQPEAQPRFQRPALFSFKTPVAVEIFTYATEDQRAAAALVAQRMGQIDGLSDIETTTRAGNPELQVRFDRRKLSRFGLQEEQVSRTLRNKIRGDVASRYREGERQIEMLVQVDEADRDAIADIRRLVINSQRRPAAQGAPGEEADPSDTVAGGAAVLGDGANADGGQAGRSRPFVPIRLGQVASVEASRGPAEIRRIRSQRAAVVTANLSGRDLTDVTEEIRGMLADIRDDLPVGATAAIGGQNEELEVSFRSLTFALGLAVLLVYLVMASQFESLVHPFIILLTVPLGLVGVVFLLALTGLALSVVALLGAVVLAGIAVNNGIVLVDYANRLRRAGLSKRDALLRAGQVRLRPILMTTLTTLLGLLPLAFGWGEGDEVRAPMAIAVIGGLLTSTPFTLLVIPVVYDTVDRGRLPANPGAMAVAGPPDGTASTGPRLANG